MEDMKVMQNAEIGVVGEQFRRVESSCVNWA